MTFLHILSYFGAVAGVLFVILSLASGLLYISEIIEEYSTYAKNIGIRSVYAIVAIHVLLYLFDSLPLFPILFSILCHIVYLQNFSSSWPFISLSSVSFIASCVLCLSDHFLWFYFFSRRTHEARMRAHRSYKPLKELDIFSFLDIATFFLVCVWLIPLFLFLSLSANDNALPTSNGLGHHMHASTPAPVNSSRTSLFKSIYDLFPRVRSSKRRQSEGIIAPHTPIVSSPPSPSIPHSPWPSQSHSDELLSPRPDIGARRVHLSMPPKRSVTSPVMPLPSPRGSSENLVDYSGKASAYTGSNLGLRRTGSGENSDNDH